MIFDQAKWIGYITDKRFHEPVGSIKEGIPCPFIRKHFDVNGKIKSAKLWITSLGLYDFYINGEKISNDRFNPGWTDYGKRLQYQVYEVKRLLKQGKNAIGCILGDGWYCGNVAIFGRGNYGEYPLLLLAQLEIKLTDGSCVIISTDRTWRASCGEILYSDILMGEFIDATKKVKDWNLPDFEDSKWDNVSEYQKNVKLVKQKDTSVRVNFEIIPECTYIFQNNTCIVDMKQNMVGWIKLTIEAEKGTKIRIRYGEMLKDNGELYTENLREAKQTDYFICNGEGKDVFEPYFTYHGFRYVEIKVENSPAKIEKLVGKVAYSAMKETSYFNCSDTMVNRLFNNILWGQRGNFFSVPTDCPQRNERMGWTGDAQIFCKTANYNMNAYHFFRKYLIDIKDAQKSDGAIADVAPNPRGIMGVGSPAWGDAITIIPYQLYLFYGDTKVIFENYNAMKKWVSYCYKNSKNFLRPECGYGDWLSINADTPKDLLATAFFAYSTDLLSKMAGIIGMIDDKNKYEDLFYKIKKAFNDAYIDSEGKVKGDTQTGYLLAIKFNLVDERLKPVLSRHLVDNLQSKNMHLSTGFVGVSYLLPVLSDMGYNDLAYQLLLNESFPSWGYSIKNGATTIWERWNSYTKEHGFGDVGMNSFNHYSLGSVGEWIMGYMGGIRIDERNVGFNSIVLQPVIDPLKRIKNVTAFYDSIRGRIESKWTVLENTVTFEFTIPTNLTAKIILPDGSITNTGDGKYMFNIKL